MIRLPNSFIGKNITLKVKFKNPIDVSYVYNDLESLPEEITKQLSDIQQMFITFADMFSTVNEYQSINYNEVIIKVPVTYKGNDYIFPIVTYVNHRYSMIRGYLFGFNKDDDFVLEFTSKKILFNKGKLFNIEIPLENIDFKESEVDSDIDKGMILFRNTNLYEHSKEPNKLVVEGYTLKYNKEAIYDENIKFNILNTEYNLEKVISSEDIFTIVDIEDIK